MFKYEMVTQKLTGSAEIEPATYASRVHRSTAELTAITQADTGLR